jgi:hypothetical protein
LLEEEHPDKANEHDFYCTQNGVMKKETRLWSTLCKDWSCLRNYTMIDGSACLEFKPIIA